MNNNFLTFIQNIENKKAIYEAFREKNVEKALDLIEKTLKKHIDELIPLVGFVETTIDGKECISKQYIVSNKDDYAKSSFFQFNWLASENSVDVYSIDFFKDLDVYWKGEDKSDLTIYTLGTSVSRFLPIIWNVVNTGNYSLSQEEAEKLSHKILRGVKESLFKIEEGNYKVYEGLKSSIIVDAFSINSKETYLNEDGEGDPSIEDIKMAIDHNKKVRVHLSKDIADKEKELESSRKDPEQIFKEMGKYISLVLKGIQPSLILCGAPGVGKTFRVKKQLKENGYKEGENLCTVKGKCTARKLYLALYGFKEKNDIVLIDDADSLVGPKADENCINILKAALDSTSDDEGRLVTYGVAGKITDDEGEEIPKKFYYKGGAIVITNYRAGQLDTALRGRSFIQDINFTSEEVLKIIERLMPDIESGILDPKSKLKSFKYLQELNKKGSDMELSLRTFVLCAKIFKACDGDDTFTDEDAQSMIEEQMKLQYARGGHKY